MSEYFEFLGLIGGLRFLRDLRFYLAIAVAQVFYIVVSLFVKPAHHIASIPSFFLLQFYVAASEELVFRGVLLGILKEIFHHIYFGISVANILAALIFAAFHFFNHPPIWALGTLFPALIFGYFREKYSLWPAIFLHFIYNSEYFILF